ncbi:NUDIX hydrolase [Viridibacillus sp. YIM B01967]|uniref:NUDIX hydrolase n=1 Tax=Viridibacillus soli TaxID=2798301 RepID=A0ABS1H9T3_9BACL|nr:NUDIX hydrolase [Viridibacillus soli]MBK3496177.1 NUDIX hydrolase [Viridibacillus soli]
MLLDKKDHMKVWLGVAGLVENNNGDWLVVMKRYGGLDGKWSLPAGFVQPAETVDQAAVREIKEETGIDATIQGLIGLRTGVLKNDISDNMAIFHLIATDSLQPIIAQLDELYEACWMPPSSLKKDERSSLIILELLETQINARKSALNNLEPDNIFGYTEYKLFF